MILVGKNPGLVTAHSNVQSSPGLEEEEYLTASAIKQARLGNIEIESTQLESQLIDDNIETGSTTSSSSISSHMSEKESQKQMVYHISPVILLKSIRKHTLTYGNTRIKHRKL